jgi:hypothetical protein
VLPHSTSAASFTVSLCFALISNTFFVSVSLLYGSLLHRTQDRILVELRLHAPHIARRMEAGSYVFLNVPAASATPWDWHPYSISSAPYNERDEFTLHVLAYVPNTESVRLLVCVHLHMFVCVIADRRSVLLVHAHIYAVFFTVTLVCSLMHAS